LRNEPRPMTEINRRLPREIERITAMCQRKEPSRRLQHMDDVRLALEEIQRDLSDPSIFTGLSAYRRRAQRWLGYGLAAILALGFGGYVWWRLSRTQSQPVIQVLTQLTSDSGLSAYPAISTDGRLVAYASDRDGAGNLEIWVQQIGGEN